MWPNSAQLNPKESNIQKLQTDFPPRRVNESTMTFHHFQDRGATLQIVPILVLVGVNVIPKPRRCVVSGGVATLQIASYQGGKPGHNFRCWSILWEPNEPCVVVVLKHMLIGVENAKKGETCYDYLANPQSSGNEFQSETIRFLGYLILAPTPNHSSDEEGLT